LFNIECGKEEFDDVEEVLEGAWKPYVMSAALWDAAHHYILTNVSVVQPWLT
jgi:hypothetical protein